MIWQGMCDDDKDGRPFALSPDGRSLLLIRDGKASAHDTNTGKITALKELDGASAVSVAFSKDGTRALTMHGRRAMLWDTRTWRYLEDYAEDTQGEFTLWGYTYGTLSPDNRFVACSHGRVDKARQLYCYDRVLKRWLRFSTSEALPAELMFDWQPGGHQLVLASEHGDVSLWDASHGAVSTPSFSLSSPASAVAYSPDGQKLLTSSDNGVTLVWSLCQEHDDSIASVPIDDVAPTAIGSYRPVKPPFFNTAYNTFIERKTVAGAHSMIWLPGTSALERLVPSATPIDAAAFSSDRKRVIVLQSKVTNNGSKKQELKLFDSKTWQQLGKALKFEFGFTNRAAFSPDNRWVAAADGSTVRLFDAKTGDPIGEPLKHDNTVHHFAFSGDGEVLVTCSSDRKARLWQPKTGKQIGKELIHGGIVTWAEESPTNEIIATAAQDDHVRLWDRSGTPLGVLQEAGPADRLVFQPKGSLLLTALLSGGVIWDINSLQQVTPRFVFRSARPVITEAVRFNKDGTALLDLDRVICDLTPDLRPADDLIKLTQLITRRHLDARGGLLPLSKMELQALWREMRAKYPEEFTVSPNAAVGWRIKQIPSDSNFHRRWLATELAEAGWQPGERGNEDMERDNYSQRLLALALHGRHAEATAAADVLAARWSKDADTLYGCARVFALAAKATTADAALADRYSTHAVGLLRQAVAAGYKDDQHILKDSDIDALRGRRDFLDFLWDLAESR